VKCRGHAICPIANSQAEFSIAFLICNRVKCRGHAICPIANSQAEFSIALGFEEKERALG